VGGLTYHGPAGPPQPRTPTGPDRPEVGTGVTGTAGRGFIGPVGVVRIRSTATADAELIVRAQRAPGEASPRRASCDGQKLAWKNVNVAGRVFCRIVGSV
jgi:hypothetical protein